MQNCRPWTPEDDGASRHVASSYTYKNGTRSKLPSRDAVFLIGSLTRPSWTRMRALLPQPRTRPAGRPPETRAPFTWGANKGSCTTGLVSASVPRDTRGGPTQGVHPHGLVRELLWRRNTGINGDRDRRAGARSYSKRRGVLGHAPMHSCVQRRPGLLVGEGERGLMARVGQEGKTCW